MPVGEKRAEVLVLLAFPLLPNEQGSCDTLPLQPQANQALCALLSANLENFISIPVGGGIKLRLQFCL